MFNGIPIQPAPALQQAGVNLTPAAQATQSLAALPALLAGIQNMFGNKQQQQTQQQNPQGTMGMLANGTTPPAQTPATPAQPAAAGTPATAGQMTVGAQPLPYQANSGYANRALTLPGQLPITGLGQAGLGASGLNPQSLFALLQQHNPNQNPFMQPPGSGFGTGMLSQIPGQTG